MVDAIDCGAVPVDVCRCLGKGRPGRVDYPSDYGGDEVVEACETDGGQKQTAAPMLLFEYDSRLSVTMLAERSATTGTRDNSYPTKRSNYGASQKPLNR